MRLLYEALPPTGPIFVPALQALFLLAAVLVAIGMVKLADAIVRGFFGTVEGTIGWIPFAGKVVKHSLHKIEQKITHALGRAERKLDEAAALGWHNMARLVSFTAQEIAGVAESAWRLAQQAENFVRRREVTHEIKSTLAPVKSAQASIREDVHNLSSEQAALKQSVAQGVYPRIRVIEHDIETVIIRDIPFGRAQARAAEDLAISTYKYLTKHRTALLSGVFTGAVAWALTRLGGGWIRCANWRKFGRAICRLPSPLMDALIAGLLAELALAHLHELAEFAQNVTEEATRGVADLLGVTGLPSGRFTIE